MNIARYFFLVFLLVSTGVFAQQDFRVTLLGTGDPSIRVDRFGPATLVEVAGQELLFDVGRGATLRLGQLDIRPTDIDGIFITHFHSDHVNGLPDLWMSGQITPRARPFELWGPKGVKSMLEHVGMAFEKDAQSRTFGRAPGQKEVEDIAHEFDESGVVYEKDGVVVTAIAVQHYAFEPSYGYRVDYDGRSVVISGDTTYDENLIEAAKGTDLIVHEVFFVSEERLNAPGPARAIGGIHTSPEDAGTVFSKVAPKLAVYTHLVTLGTEEPLLDLVARTRTTYDGPLVVGEDLMTFVLDGGITVLSRKP